MQIIIRPAVISDAASMARVRVETWRTSYRGLIPDASIAGMDIEKETKRSIERFKAPVPNSCLFVAEVRPETGDELPEMRPFVAGFCGCGRDRDGDPQYSGELFAIYVLPAYQRKGLGLAMVQACVDWLRQNGHQSMLIWVLRDNQPARRFYEALGGKAVRKRSIEIGGARLPEVGYGYDLTRWPAQH
jgi:ribosomal protein S18 acetylase RimI-like enzyme